MGVGRSKNDDSGAEAEDNKDSDVDTENVQTAAEVKEITEIRNSDDPIDPQQVEIDPVNPQSLITEQDDSESLSGSIGEERELERKPGLIPFTSVPIDNSLADSLLESSLVYGWLMRKTVFDRLPTDRWCALHENYIYEFEDDLGEMVLKEKVNLKGCICYIDEGALTSETKY